MAESGGDIEVAAPEDFAEEMKQLLDPQAEYDASFPYGHDLVPTSGEGNLCGLNAVVNSANAQQIQPEVTLDYLQTIANSPEYITACAPGTDDSTQQNDYTASQLAVLVMLFGSSSDEQLQLGFSKFTRSRRSY